MLTISELAETSGVTAATLRMWEARHGFPTPERLPSGHRRYAEAQVAQVLEVLRRRAAGTRLEAAIQQVVRDSGERTSGSVYAGLLRGHPAQPRQRLRKSTLLAMSWAIEDEIAASGASGHLFGAFQTRPRFAAARPRWSELARVAKATYAFADFDESDQGRGPGALELVPLSPSSPMRREWAVVHDSPELPVALTAWELPGQHGTADRDRLFESIWTLDPAAVRDAAVCCAHVAADAGHASATDLLAGPLAGSPPAPPDVLAVTRLAHRVVGYIDAGTALGGP